MDMVRWMGPHIGVFSHPILTQNVYSEENLLMSFSESDIEEFGLLYINSATDQPCGNKIRFLRHSVSLHSNILTLMNIC